jgi:hypothetical protein
MSDAYICRSLLLRLLAYYSVTCALPSIFFIVSSTLGAALFLLPSGVFFIFYLFSKYNEQSNSE